MTYFCVFVPSWAIFTRCCFPCSTFCARKRIGQIPEKFLEMKVVIGSATLRSWIDKRSCKTKLQKVKWSVLPDMDFLLLWNATKTLEESRNLFNFSTLMSALSPNLKNSVHRYHAGWLNRTNARWKIVWFEKFWSCGSCKELLFELFTCVLKESHWFALSIELLSLLSSFLQFGWASLHCC